MSHELVTIDFETYYSQEYSLSKLTTEQYVRDPRFQVIGMGYKVGDQPAEWYPGEQAEAKLATTSFANKVVLCHNTAFDGAILSWRFNVRPALWLDTLSMARPKHGLTVGGSLKALAEHYGVGEKGTEVVKAMGKRLEDFTPQDLAQYGEYCKNDCDLTLAIFKLLRQGFPAQELKIIDLMLRMYINPTFELNVEVLATHLAEVKQKKAELMARITASKEDLMSDERFADLLRARGVDPPVKLSAAKSKTADKDVYTYAFAKTDTDFIDLLEHDDLEVQALVAARLGNKSTIEETRTERLLGIADRGRLPIMLNYYGAHTGRASGGDKINPQNFSRGGAIRRSLEAPGDFAVVAGDSSQIEARLTAYIAEQNDLVEDFRNKVDIYSNFATEIYGFPVTKANKNERHVGKTCLAGGTLVVTNRGTIPLTEVTTKDLLWDGQEWVPHEGVLLMGEKEVVQAFGLSATDDHEILTEHGWAPWRQVRSNRSLFESALVSGSSRYYAGNAEFRLEDGHSDTSQSANVHAAGKDSLIDRIYEPVTLPDATHVRNSQQGQKDIGSISTQCLTTRIGLDYLTGLLLQLRVAILRLVEPINTTVAAASPCTQVGFQTAQNFLPTCALCPDGTTRASISTGSTTTKVIARAIFVLLQRVRTLPTSEKWKYSRQKYESLKKKCAVYDVANAGPRNRFTVITDAGPVIVHNCILGLGFGTGAAKLRWSLASKEPRVYVEEHEAKQYVDLYRQKYSRIPVLWKRFNSCLDAIMLGGEPMKIGPNGGIVVANQEGILLPNGMYVRYPGLEYDGEKYTYYNRRKPEKIFGAKVTENCIAAGTQVLTLRGWIPIEEVRTSDLVHDGVEFVKHGGTVSKYVQPCVTVDGVAMTADHEVLTDEGWKTASSLQGSHRADFWRPQGFAQQAWSQAHRVVVSMPLRAASMENGQGGHQGATPRGDAELRVLDEVSHLVGQQNPRDEQTSGLRRVAQHVRSLSTFVASSLAQLRRAGYPRVQPLAEVVREFLGRHGRYVQAWANSGTCGQRQGVLAGELCVGHAQGASAQQTWGYPRGRSSTVRENGYLEVDALLPAHAWMAREGSGPKAMSEQPVYDILNCGPRHRFVVKGAGGPLVVHNCVQALARIIVFDQMVEIDNQLKQRQMWVQRQGLSIGPYRVVLTVHDEVVCIVPKYDTVWCKDMMEEVMSRPPSWAPDLPIACEVGAGPNYGEAK